MSQIKHTAFNVAEEIESSPAGRYVRPTCMAQGCPCSVSYLTDPENGTGLCVYHQAAKSAEDWPFITELLKTDSCRYLRGWLWKLDQDSRNGEQDAVILRDISRCQRFALAFGFTKDEVCAGFENVRPGEKLECPVTLPRDYSYRMSMALIKAIAERSHAQESGQAVDYLANTLKWTEIALARITGRSREAFA